MVPETLVTLRYVRLPPTTSTRSSASGKIDPPEAVGVVDGGSKQIQLRLLEGRPAWKSAFEAIGPSPSTVISISSNERFTLRLADAAPRQSTSSRRGDAFSTAVAGLPTTAGTVTVPPKTAAIASAARE
jgi:hypothetical protein